MSRAPVLQSHNPTSGHVFESERSTHNYHNCQQSHSENPPSTLFLSTSRSKNNSSSLSRLTRKASENKLRSSTSKESHDNSISKNKANVPYQQQNKSLSTPGRQQNKRTLRNGVNVFESATTLTTGNHKSDDECYYSASETVTENEKTHSQNDSNFSNDGGDSACNGDYDDNNIREKSPNTDQDETSHFEPEQGTSHDDNDRDHNFLSSSTVSLPQLFTRSQPSSPSDVTFAASPEPSSSLLPTSNNIETRYTKDATTFTPFLSEQLETPRRASPPACRGKHSRRPALASVNNPQSVVRGKQPKRFNKKQNQALVPSITASHFNILSLYGIQRRRIVRLGKIPSLRSRLGSTFNKSIYHKGTVVPTPPGALPEHTVVWARLSADMPKNSVPETWPWHLAHVVYARPCAGYCLAYLHEDGECESTNDYLIEWATGYPHPRLLNNASASSTLSSTSARCPETRRRTITVTDSLVESANEDDSAQLEKKPSYGDSNDFSYDTLPKPFFLADSRTHPIQLNPLDGQSQSLNDNKHRSSGPEDTHENNAIVSQSQHAVLANDSLEEQTDAIVTRPPTTTSKLPSTIPSKDYSNYFTYPFEFFENLNTSDNDNEKEKVLNSKTKNQYPSSIIGKEDEQQRLLYYSPNPSSYSDLPDPKKRKLNDDVVLDSLQNTSITEHQQNADTLLSQHDIETQNDNNNNHTLSAVENDDEPLVACAPWHFQYYIHFQGYNRRYDRWYTFKDLLPATLHPITKRPSRKAISRHLLSALHAMPHPVLTTNNNITVNNNIINTKIDEQFQHNNHITTSNNAMNSNSLLFSNACALTTLVILRLMLSPFLTWDKNNPTATTNLSFSPELLDETILTDSPSSYHIIQKFLSWCTLFFRPAPPPSTRHSTPPLKLNNKTPNSLKTSKKLDPPQKSCQLSQLWWAHTLLAYLQLDLLDCLAAAHANSKKKRKSSTAASSSLHTKSFLSSNSVNNSPCNGLLLFLHSVCPSFEVLGALTGCSKTYSLSDNEFQKALHATQTILYNSRNISSSSSSTLSNQSYMSQVPIDTLSKTHRTIITPSVDRSSVTSTNNLPKDLSGALTTTTTTTMSTLNQQGSSLSIKSSTLASVQPQGDENSESCNNHEDCSLTTKEDNNDNNNILSSTTLLGNPLHFLKDGNDNHLNMNYNSLPRIPDDIRQQLDSIVNMIVTRASRKPTSFDDSSLDSKQVTSTLKSRKVSSHHHHHHHHHHNSQSYHHTSTTSTNTTTTGVSDSITTNININNNTALSQQHRLSSACYRNCSGIDSYNDVVSDPGEHEGMDKASIEAHETTTKLRTINKLQIDEYLVPTWYYSPFPLSCHPLDTLYVCGGCLDFFNREVELKRHELLCSKFTPPGDEIYRDGRLSFFEVDGQTEWQYCENLSLISKLFLDHKTLQYSVAPFLFYVLMEWDDAPNNNNMLCSPLLRKTGLTVARNCQLVGYFSKEKVSSMGYNLACILTFPQHQRKGYGKYFIHFSYSLSKIENKFGTPERPLSDLGRVSYTQYWKQILAEFLLSPADCPPACGCFFSEVASVLSCGPCSTDSCPLQQRNNVQNDNSSSVPNDFFFNSKNGFHNDITTNDTSHLCMGQTSLSIDDIAHFTSIRPDDIIATLKLMGAFYLDEKTGDCRIVFNKDQLLRITRSCGRFPPPILPEFFVWCPNYTLSSPCTGDEPQAIKTTPHQRTHSTKRFYFPSHDECPHQFLM